MKEHRPKILTNFFDPIKDFIEQEAFAGILLLFVTAITLIVANSPLSHLYHDFCEAEIGFVVRNFSLQHSLHFLVNDLLMAIFFLLVGLEIKREILYGELSSLKQAMLPIIAATGGMLFPALIFLVFNENTSLSSAWGIPVATDIAFALGVISILGNRVPLSLKIFLTALAIVDDIGAVIVIAINYSKNIQWDYVLYAFGVIGLLLTFNLLKVKRLRIYLIAGIVLWFFIMNTGFHATLTGVILAFLIPSSPKISIEEFLKVSKETLEQLIQSDTEDDAHSVAIMQQNAILQIKENTDRIINPSQQLVHILHPIVSFFIMPFFAFVNAGINLTSPAEIFSNPLAIRLSLGIIIGLILGKMIGIFLTSWLAIKLKIASLNDMPTIRQFIGIATFGGIGFTMSIFISNLAISDVGLLNTAKLSVLLASILAALIGIIILWRK